LKKPVIALLAVWLCFCAALTASAADTKIKTDTPDWVSVTVALDSGQVRINGETYGSGALVMIPYGASVTLEFLPDSGKAVKNILLDGEDVTASVTDGKYVIAGLLRDMVLNVSQNDTGPTTGSTSETATGGTKPTGGTPQTGGNNHIAVWLWIGGIGLFTAVSAALVKSKRQKDRSFL